MACVKLSAVVLIVFAAVASCYGRSSGDAEERRHRVPIAVPAHDVSGSSPRGACVELDDNGQCAYAPPKASEEASASASASLEAEAPALADHHSKNEKKKVEVGQLRPCDLPEPEVFNSFSHNSTLILPDGTPQLVSHGSVSQVNNLNNPKSNHKNPQTEISLLPSVVPRSAIRQMLHHLESYDDYDDDPDTVDGMPTYEMFIYSDGLYDDPGPKWRDADQHKLKHRIPLRQKLLQITQPLLDDLITPLVRMRYPDICNRTTARGCTPCYSLIRRYKYGERQSHATHHDGHAIVTVVVSLSTYDEQYRGGLYVSTGYGQRAYMGLNQGDAVMHRSTLLHGVKVHPIKDHPQNTQRWSWILWYRDSQTCQDHGHEWFAECAAQGDAICQQLHATKVGGEGNLTPAQMEREIVRLNKSAAEGGSGESAVKMARAYLKLLPSSLPLDATLAQMYFAMAVKSHNPEGHYGLAQMMLAQAATEEQTHGTPADPQLLSEVVAHLEQGAKLGHVFSMFNLGLVHVFGYGVPVDMARGAEWFVECGLPEGYYTAANYAQSIGDEEKFREYMERAEVLGFGQVWRSRARQQVGSGGAGGVDLNLEWPTSLVRGMKPPKYD